MADDRNPSLPERIRRSAVGLSRDAILGGPSRADLGGELAALRSSQKLVVRDTLGQPYESRNVLSSLSPYGNTQNKRRKQSAHVTSPPRQSSTFRSPTPSSDYSVQEWYLSQPRNVSLSLPVATNPIKDFASLQTLQDRSSSSLQEQPSFQEQPFDSWNAPVFRHFNIEADPLLYQEKLAEVERESKSRLRYPGEEADEQSSSRPAVAPSVQNQDNDQHRVERTRAAQRASLVSNHLSSAAYASANEQRNMAHAKLLMDTYAGTCSLSRDMTRHAMLAEQQLRNLERQAEQLQAGRLHVAANRQAERQSAHQQDDEEEDQTDLLFHCPYHACHHRLADPSSHYIRSPPAEGAEGLACVHTGCAEAFVDRSDWRVHICEAHHDLVPAYRGTDDNGAQFEQIWKEHGME